MDPTLIDKINASPSLKWVALAIVFQILNVFLGAYVGFFKKSPQLLKIHKILFFTVVFCLSYFLVLNGIHSINTVWDYLIGLYFITLVPFSKRWDVVFHGLIGILGLLLLPVLILMQFI